MKKSNFNRIIFFIISCIYLSSCAIQANKPQLFSTAHKTHQLDNLSHLTEKEKIELFKNITAGDLSVANGEYELATSYYLAAARLSKNIYLIKLCIETAKNTKDELAAIQAADIWLEISPNNTEALLLKITSLLSHHNIKSAIQFTKVLFNQRISQTTLFKHFENIISTLHPAAVNAYLKQLSISYPKMVSIHTGQAALYAKMANKTRNPGATTSQALLYLQTALNLKKNFIPAVELKVKLLFQSKNPTQALTYLQKLFSQYPRSKAINTILGEVLYDLKKYPQAATHYSKWLKKHKKDLKSRFYLAATYYAQEKYQQSLKHYQKMLGTNYQTQLVYVFCGHAASRLKEYQQAINCYKKVTAGKYLTRAKIELAKIYSLTDQIDKALATVRNVEFASDENKRIQLINLEIEILYQHVGLLQAQQRLNKALVNHPDNMNLLIKKIKINELADKPNELIPLLFLAKKQIKESTKIQSFNLAVAAYLHSKNYYQQAVSWLDEALKDSPNNNDYLYTRALYKEPLGHYDEMIADFKLLLSLEPENINVINALGYTLVDRNKELDYASQLIDQAYLAKPNNPAIIDSKGWLAYRQGLYPQALTYLIAAYELSPSADVAAHIGEVYWVSGDKEKAVIIWQQAKNIDPNNYLLLDILKRFDVKLK